ncbi:MAG: tyrosine-type recombinase/integrase [Clostridium sp.]|uniref:tyrosine-type recombinase/integrase n=1 Tax=Clostridium sp. TaxID=1506 RepID=UPI003D6D108F
MARGHIRKRVYKSGTTWQITIELGIDENGERQRMFKSIYGTKKDAEKEMQQMLNELDGGTFVEDTKITVASYLRNWIKIYVEPNLAPTTIDGYKSNVENYIIPRIGNILLQKLSPMHLQDMYLKLSQNGRLDGKGGLSPTTIRAIHRTLGKALDQALRMEQIKRNVSTLVTIPKVKPYKAEIYDEVELINLLNVCKGTEMEVPITLGATLGLRRGEILGLKWSDINLKECRMTINNNLVSTSAGAVFTTPKTNKSCRTLELSEGIITLLKEHNLAQKENRIKLGSAYGTNDLVCCYPDGNIYEPKNFSKKFAWFLKSKGLKHIRLHDLRHSNATLMLTYGIPAKVASERLGHSSISITLDLYSHVTANMQKDVADKIENGIFNRLTASSN